MKPITQAEEISEIAFGFMASKALFVALHTGVFTILSKGVASAQEVSKRSGIPLNRMTTLLTTLKTLGLVVGDDDEYANSPGAESFLVQGAKFDFGNYLRYQVDRQMFSFMQGLEGVVKDEIKEGQIDSYAKWMEDPEEARLYSESQHSGSLGPGLSLARMLDLSAARKMLDVAGGTGGMAIRLCEANPQLETTILDFPNVIAVGEKYVAEAGLADRISFMGGNALTSEWPKEVDVVLMSYLYSGVPGEEIPGLAAHAFEALNPGGHYIVHDFMVDDNREGPKLAALWQLQHMAFTPDARSVTPGWASETLSAAGFIDIEVKELIQGMTKVVIARKP